MSDEDLRELERAFRAGDAASGRRWLAALERSGASEEALLKACFETGAIDGAKLELAAFLGHAPAGWATERRGAIEDVLETGFFAADPELRAAVRCVTLVAAARRYLPFFPASEARPLVAVEAAEAWLRCPCGEHANAAQAAGDAALRASGADPFCEPECCWERETGAVFVAAAPALAVLEQGHPRWDISSFQLGRAFAWHEDHVDVSVRAEDSRHAMRAAALSWALSRSG